MCRCFSNECQTNQVQAISPLLLQAYHLITKERKSVSTYSDHIGMKCKATKSRRTLKILITIDKKGKEKKVNMQIDAIMCVMPVVSDQRPRFQVNKYC